MKKLFTSIILGLLSVSFVFAQETSSKTVDYTHEFSNNLYK